ncbi:MAG: hypothetical protein LKI53_03875 [Bacteroidales bacterium]|jgi:hypothetical protein|nr:hypothetical protein [Bacteroidales bacterium]
MENLKKDPEIVKAGINNLIDYIEEKFRELDKKISELEEKTDVLEKMLNDISLSVTKDYGANGNAERKFGEPLRKYLEKDESSESENEEDHDETVNDEEDEDTGTVSLNVNDSHKRDWYDWEIDYPQSYIDDISEGFSYNDKFEFEKELFNKNGNLDQAENDFNETIKELNGMENFKQAVSYMRKNYPEWDEESDEVYRFYMIVRRKFNKEKEEEDV